MSTLFDALHRSVNALRETGEGLAITQMNLTNVGVAGYAKQNFIQQSDSFDLTRGLMGGMQGQSSSARDLFAERAVWSLTSQKGFYDGFTQATNGVDSVLGLSGDQQSGLQGTLASLYRSFNVLRQGPSEQLNQEDVVRKAQALAQTLSETADFVANSNATAQQRIQITVDQINSIVKGVQQWNSMAGSSDPVAEAQVYASLEQLSSLIPITAQKETNGTFTILLNGQTPLLQGAAIMPVSVSYSAPDSDSPFPEADAELRIVDSTGTDITGAIKGGQLGGLIDFTNRFTPALLGNANQQGDLNRIAQSIANSVNAAIGGSTPIFKYDSNPTSAARTLKLNPGLSAQDLAVAINANPSALANLTAIIQGTDASNQIDRQSYSNFLVSSSTRVALEISTANDGLTLRNSLVEQAKSFRESVQAPTTEESAVALLEYQRAFQAAAKVIGVIDQLTQTTLDMVR